MMDRGIIKWKPFDSCYSSQKIINEVINEKRKIKMPTLSEDQINDIENQVLEAFNLKSNIYIEYFYDGNIKSEYGKIYNINKNEKKIYLNHKYIYFKQILLIKL